MIKKQLNEFKKFILRGNVVELAVAVIIGAAFTGVVTAMTDGIIKPVINSFGSAEVGKGLSYVIRPGDATTTLEIGKLISTTVNFLIVAAVVFFLIIQPLNKFMAKVKPADEVDKPSERSCPACMSAIPSTATRCKFCTTKFDKAGKITKG